MVVSVTLLFCVICYYNLKGRFSGCCLLFFYSAWHFLCVFKIGVIYVVASLLKSVTNTDN